MFYLGIDIGKNTHVASLIDDKKKVIFKAFSFSNSIDGANSLLEKLSPFIQSLEIGMEATGRRSPTESPVEGFTGTAT